MRAMIMAYGAVGEAMTAAYVENEIARHEAVGFDEFLFVFKSTGGDVEEASRIVEVVFAAQNRGLKTAALIDGPCNSAASWIAIACGPIWARPAGSMLVHNASPGEDDDAQVRERSVKAAAQWSVAMERLYSTKSGTSQSEWRQLMDSETTLDVDQLLALGLIDGVVAPNAMPPEAE